VANARKTDQEIVRIETQVLSALCRGTTEGPILDFGCETLRQYEWRHPAHQVLFEALMAIPSERPETIRAQIPSRLTRMGFPDLDWEALFARPLLSKPDAGRLIKQLSESRGR
jgi:hypothetical protein